MLSRGGIDSTLDDVSSAGEVDSVLEDVPKRTVVVEVSKEDDLSLASFIRSSQKLSCPRSSIGRCTRGSQAHS